MIKPVVVIFNSSPEYYWKELEGIKNNTVRKLSKRDKRFKILKEIEVMVSAEGHLTEDFLIKITNNKTNNFFIRQIKDVSFWEDFVIITWRN